MYEVSVFSYLIDVLGSNFPTKCEEINSMEEKDKKLDSKP